MRGTLLDSLASFSGLMISDLRCRETHKRVLQYLKRLPVGGYSLDEWNYSLCYIFGSGHAFQSAEEVEEFLRRLPG